MVNLRSLHRPASLVLVLALASALVLSSVSRASDEPDPTAARVGSPIPADVIVRRDLAYDPLPRQKLDLYFLKGRSGTPRPLVVFLHGGGWTSGSKADGQEWALRLVRSGYAVACVDYRLGDDAKFPAQLEDCKSAIRWLRGNAVRYALDVEHVAAMGIEAGGHLALLAGSTTSTALYETGGSMEQNSRVNAVIDLGGPTDLVALYEESVKTNSPMAEAIVALIGNDPKTSPIPGAASNPANSVDVQCPPFLMIHGDRDAAVPLSQPRAFYAASAKGYAKVRLHIIRGGTGAESDYERVEIREIIERFLAATLKTGSQDLNLPMAIVTESVLAHPVEHQTSHIER